MRGHALALIAVGLLSLAPSAFADDLPAGTRKTTNATTGTTDVAKGGFATAPELAKDKEKEQQPDFVKGDLTLGALVAAGNARSAAFTVGAGLKTRLATANVLTFDVGLNYARAGKIGDAAGVQQTVGNFQARGRYERFFTPAFAGFAMVTARYDKFQGLDMRFNFDPGVAYHFLHEDDQRLWGEVGYDLQVDARNHASVDAANAGALAKDPAATPLDYAVVRQAARAFVGYDHTLRPGVNLTTGFEYLQGIAEGMKSKPENIRFNWDVGLKAKIAGELAVGVSVVLKYDNKPLPNVQNADVTSGINLSYGFDTTPKKK